MSAVSRFRSIIKIPFVFRAFLMVSFSLQLVYSFFFYYIGIWRTVGAVAELAFDLVHEGILYNLPVFCGCRVGGALAWLSCLRLCVRGMACDGGEGMVWVLWHNQVALNLSWMILAHQSAWESVCPTGVQRRSHNLSNTKMCNLS